MCWGQVFVVTLSHLKVKELKPRVHPKRAKDKRYFDITRMAFRRIDLYIEAYVTLKAVLV